MTRGIIVDKKPGVTILGGGEIYPTTLEQALNYAPFLVAADGGANHAFKLDHELTALIGDLDSVDPAIVSSLSSERVHRISEQETSDFDKCLRSVSAPLILAVGFTGARLDHELAAFSVLVRYAHKPVVFLGPEDVVFVAPRQFNLSLPVGTRVSLFPMGEVQGQSSGLKWPIDGIDFSPEKRIGTSNETVSENVDLTFSNRNMLTFLPSKHLSEAIKVMTPHYGAENH